MASLSPGSSIFLGINFSVDFFLSSEYFLLKGLPVDCGALLYGSSITFTSSIIPSTGS